MEQLVLKGRVSGRVMVRDGPISVVVRPRSRLVDCTFQGFRFSDSWVVGTDLPGGRVTFERCVFEDCFVDEPDIGRARFLDCTFAAGHWREWFAFTQSFERCRFTGTLTKVIFHARDTSAPRPLQRRNRIIGNDFTGAQLRDCDFRGGVDLSDQRFPDDGSTLLFPDASAWASRLEQEARGAEPDVAQELRVQAELALEAAEDGQRQVFLHRSTVDASRPEQMAAWQILTELWGHRGDGRRR